MKQCKTKRALHKSTSITLIIAVLLSFMPFFPNSGINASAAALTEGYYTYTVENGNATITNFDTSVSGEIIIPDTLGGYPVTAIGDSAFSGCHNLESISIHGSITSIGVLAFSNCRRLTAIAVDEQNENYCDIDGVLFSKDKTKLIAYPEANGLAYVIPDGVTSIGDFAFYCCTNLEVITIPKSVTSIGNSAFAFCIMLLNIRIPSSVTSIEEKAFYNCSGLISITIPNSVASIGEEAFSYCSRLNSVTIPNSVTSIGNLVFYKCSGLTNVTIPNSVSSIGEKAFSYCYNLVNITIPNSVTSIGNSAFELCPALKSISIPKSVTSFGANIFANCKNVIICCEEFSSAHNYAKENNIKYKLVEILSSANGIRLSGKSRYDTAIAISNEGWESAETVILANAMNYADALAGVPYAGSIDAPVLLTAGGAELEASVLAQIEKLGAKNIVILGGKLAVSEEIKNTLSQDYSVERISGSSRYATSLMIAQKLNANPEQAIIVTGTGYADALSVSPYAAMEGIPILYANPATGLTEEMLAYLANAQDITIIGGEKAVTPVTVSQLSGKNITRISGRSRYLTSYEIAKEFSSFFGNDVMLATGTNFPDALAGGVLAAKLKTPLLLTDKTAVIAETQKYILSKNPNNVYILGGENAVLAKLVEDIFA